MESNKQTYRMVITKTETGEVVADVKSDCILAVANALDRDYQTCALTAIAANAKTIVDTVRALDELSEKVLTSSPSIAMAAVIDRFKREPKAVLDGLAKILDEMRGAKSDSENKITVSDEELERLKAHFAGNL